jgi:hypothetical protein
MCQPHGIHPKAQLDYDDIQRKGSRHQQWAITVAYCDAILVAQRKSLNGLSDTGLGNAISQVYLMTFPQGTVTTFVAFAHQGGGACLDAYAFDIDGWHAPPPCGDRAYARL